MASAAPCRLTANLLQFLLHLGDGVTQSHIAMVEKAKFGSVVFEGADHDCLCERCCSHRSSV
jgi:hypothetical protein